MLELPPTLTHAVDAIPCNLYRQYVCVEYAVYAKQIISCLQLAGAQHIEDVFSLCFGGVEGDGALMLGDVPPASVNVSLQYTPLVSSLAHPHYYLAKLNDLSVNGSILPVDQVCCKLPSHTHQLCWQSYHNTNPRCYLQHNPTIRPYALSSLSVSYKSARCVMRLSHTASACCTDTDSVNPLYIPRGL